MEKFLFAKIEVWVLLLVAILAGIGVVGFGAAALNVEQGGHRFGLVGKVAHSVFGVVDTVEIMLKEGDAMVVAMNDRADGSGWSFPDGKTASGLPGYWLMSRHIAAEKRTVIELVRLSDNEVVYTWNPDASQLYAGANATFTHARSENWTNARYRAFHPFLMDNGDLLVKDSHAPLMRIDSCAKRVWMQDSVMFHHTTESDGAGGFWITAIVEPSNIPYVSPQFEDLSLAHVSADGKVLQNFSAGEMLIRHGMQAIVFPPFAKADDPLHLNDIQPVTSDGPFWKKGDLFISLRHPSMVLLYRPATDEIVWQRSGLWMAQHDVDILDDHRIAIFDNRSYYRGSFGRVAGTSDIAIYDFATDQVTHPYTAALARENVVALFEGLVDFLPGGAFVLEDHNTGRILIFGADGEKLGQFVNKAADGKVYQIGWGRYIDAEYGQQVLQKLVGTKCDA